MMKILVSLVSHYGPTNFNDMAARLQDLYSYRAICDLANTQLDLKHGLCQWRNEHRNDLSHHREGDHPGGGVQIVYSKTIEGKPNVESSERGSTVRSQVRSAKCSQDFRLSASH